MPRIRITGPEPRGPITWQETIADRVRSGKLVPIVSGDAGADLVLGGAAGLAESYATYTRYPLPGRNLAAIAQFKFVTDDAITDALALKEDYVRFIKSRLMDLAEADHVAADTLEEVDAEFDQLPFGQMCDRLGYPRYGDEMRNPLLLLANLDLPIYVTTGYHEFLEAALRRAGKAPRTDFARWHQAVEDQPSVFDANYEPTRQAPLVYHLYGVDTVADSLVLAEDDYLTFLVAASQNFGRTTDPVHMRVRQALSDSSLFLLGYELQSWDFRALFWGALVERTRSLTSVVGIQIEPSEVEKQYLQKYLDVHHFQVAWGNVSSTVQQLCEAVADGR